MTTVTCATALCTGNLVDTMMVMVTVPVLELIYIRGPGFLLRLRARLRLLLEYDKRELEECY